MIFKCQREFKQKINLNKSYHINEATYYKRNTKGNDRYSNAMLFKMENILMSYKNENKYIKSYEVRFPYKCYCFTSRSLFVPQLNL